MLWALVLGLVFVGELLALVGLGVWGWHVGGSPPLAALLAVLVPAAAATLWGLFAAPRANHRGRWATPATKLLVLGGASLALWHGGRPGWALALLALNLVANAAARHPRARAIAAPKPGRSGSP